MWSSSLFPESPAIDIIVLYADCLLQHSRTVAYPFRSCSALTCLEVDLPDIERISAMLQKNETISVGLALRRLQTKEHVPLHGTLCFVFTIFFLRSLLAKSKANA